MILKVLKIGPTYGKYIEGNHESKKAMSLFSNIFLQVACGQFAEYMIKGGPRGLCLERSVI